MTLWRKWVTDYETRSFVYQKSNDGRCRTVSKAPYLGSVPASFGGGKYVKCFWSKRLIWYAPI